MAKVTKMTKMLEIMETKYDEDVKDVEDKKLNFFQFPTGRLLPPGNRLPRLSSNIHLC